MRQFLLVMAVACLATSGCANNRLGGCGNCCQQGCHITRAQRAPRPNICRTACRPSRGSLDLFGKRNKSCCETACGYSDTCCDDGCCGSCEAECGYADCGCEDSCCDTCETECGYPDDCCDAGCCGTCDSGGCCGNGCSGCANGQCSSGRCGPGSRGGCSACGGRGCGLCQRMAGRVASDFCPHAAGYPESHNFTPSPPSGQVAYPYYTVRGPRDFLRDNPPSIGPY